MGMFHDLVHLFGRLGHDYDLPYDRPAKPCATGDCWYDAHGQHCPHGCEETAAEFDEMWDSATPVETVTLDRRPGSRTFNQQSRPGVEADGCGAFADPGAPNFLDTIADQLTTLTELVRDIRNLLNGRSLWETESDLLAMAAADQRIAERLKHRNK